jgi:hypothetical protein
MSEYIAVAEEEVAIDISIEYKSDNNVADTESIILDNLVLNINKENIIYPNEKIYQVAPIIEEKIIERDNYQPSACLLRCQNCIKMMLDIAMQIYIFLENCIQWISMILVVIDVFNITRKKIKINGRSKYNYFSIESSQTERLRRIVYWFYYNNVTPAEDEWRVTIARFNLIEIPKFTIRLFINNEKSKYSIELYSITLQTCVDGIIIKGNRTIKLYEDVIDENVNDIIINNGKRLLKTVDGKIPIGGLLPERLISDLGIDKILSKSANSKRDLIEKLEKLKEESAIKAADVDAAAINKQD